MSFCCGFVGLPNVGKSTLFNALCKGGAAAANFPFCTIEPNSGMVPVPDARLDVLSKMEHSGKIVPSMLKFIDIAGLVKGASKGEGLGNQFLGHIRNVDAVAHVVRIFDNPDIIHVNGHTDPAGDLEVILTELMLSDLETLEKRYAKISKTRSHEPEVVRECELVKEFMGALSDGKLPVWDKDDPKIAPLVRDFGLISTLPAFVCANADETSYAAFGKDDATKRLIEFAAGHNMKVIPVCAKLEEEFGELEPEEAKLFMEEMGIRETGLSSVIRTGYELLNYITFFTAGEMESHAWTTQRGTPAPVAVCKIHTDIGRGFICMETVSYEDMVACGSWNKAKEAGKLRLEGKEYIMQDGDVIHVRFSV
ncbi:MAG: redox-regulated ATPase YchF [Victivallaceae bacterium]|nr:redox-regulated ATPase YchF [Victivallaceae bacterium]